MTMARIDVSMIGDKALEQALRALPEKLETKVVRQALRKAAKPTLEQAKQNLQAIRVTGERTDRIRTGMKIRALKRKKGRLGVMVMTPTRQELGIDETAASSIPAHIELGTRNSPARPFLRSALKATRQEVFAILRRDIQAGIERVSRG